MRNIKLIALVSIGIVLLPPTIECSYAYTLLSPAKGITEDRLDINGQAYFNVTHAGLQHEKYILNQQLSTIKLSSNFRPNPWIRMHSLWVYNATPSPLYPHFYIDEAFLELKKPYSQSFLSMGKQWLPFGNYKSDLIYKPLTKALSQTNEYSIIAGQNGPMYTNISLFKPHTRSLSARLPLYYNVNVGLKNKNDYHDYDLGVSYLYSLTESDLFQYNKGFGGFLNQTIYSHVPGVASYANLKYKKWNTNLSYVSAVTAFNKNEMSFQEHGALPRVVSVQTGYEFNIKMLPVKFIGFYDRSFQALALRLPEERVGIGLNLYPSRYMDLQFQYSKDYNYRTGAIATGNNQSITGSSTVANTLAMQLVINF